MSTLTHLALVGPELGSGQGPDLTRYLTVVGILILAVAGIAWGFRRVVGGALRKRATLRSLQVVDVLPLGGRRQLAVVRCYDRTFALGLGEKEVSLVAELDPVEAPAGATDAGEGEDERERAFRSLIARAQERVRGARPQAPAPTSVKELVG